MKGRRAAWLSACVALVLVLILVACGGSKAIGLSATAVVADTAVVATPIGPTPTPLANGLRPAATPVTAAAPAPSQAPPAPANGAAPTAGTPRAVIQQFYDAMLAKRNIGGFLAPDLRAASNGDGYALLGAQPPIRRFSVDSQEMSADGNGATVGSTLVVANGTTKPLFTMEKQANTWLISKVAPQT